MLTTTQTTSDKTVTIDGHRRQIRHLVPRGVR